MGINNAFQSLWEPRVWFNILYIDVNWKYQRKCYDRIVAIRYQQNILMWVFKILIQHSIQVFVNQIKLLNDKIHTIKHQQTRLLYVVKPINV